MSLRPNRGEQVPTCDGVTFLVYLPIGPMPMHDVVVMAVRNAVSAATTTFTSVSMILLLFMATSFLV